jgi:hypothetical protein
MFSNKKGMAAMEWVVILVIMLVAAYLVINWSSKGIKDAGGEFFSILNLNTANCDHDFDGTKDKKDICPCDSDDYFDSRTYYVADATDCTAMRKCQYDTTTTRIERFSECSAKAAAANTELKSEADMIRYSINLDVSACKKWYDLKGKEKLDSTYRTECTGYSSTEKEIVFTQNCADKILSWYKEANRLTFTCRTSTSKCKDILKKEC